MSCVKKEINSVLIQNDKSSEIDLFRGIYIVHFMEKQDAIYSFPISEKEIYDLKESFNKENLFKYGKEFLLLDSKAQIMPTFDIKYVISFTDGSKQIIIIRSDFRQDPLSDKRYKSLKKFVDKINEILYKKSEIQNLPKSDIFYL